MARPVFLYGTLVDLRVLARRSGDPRLPRLSQPALLHGHARVAFRGTPYPTLTRRPGGVVRGLLIRPTPAALARLRRYEGPCYRLVPLKVLAERGPVMARAWMVPRHLCHPSEWRPAGLIRAGGVRP